MSCLNLSKGHICFDFRYSNITLWSLPSLLSNTWLDASTETVNSRSSERALGKRLYLPSSRSYLHGDNE